MLQRIDAEGEGFAREERFAAHDSRSLRTASSSPGRLTRAATTLLIRLVPKFIENQHRHFHVAAGDLPVASLGFSKLMHAKHGNKLRP